MRFKKYNYKEAVKLLKSKDNTISVMYHYIDNSSPLYPWSPVRPSMLKNGNMYVTKLENTKWYRETTKKRNKRQNTIKKLKTKTSIKKFSAEEFMKELKERVYGNK